MPQDPRPAQRIAAVILGIALALLALWMLQSFLAALVWALVIAVATWPLYRRFERGAPGDEHRRALPALLFTLLVALVLVLPIGVGAVEVGRETFRSCTGRRKPRPQACPRPIG